MLRPAEECSAGSRWGGGCQRRPRATSCNAVITIAVITKKQVRRRCQTLTRTARSRCSGGSGRRRWGRQGCRCLRWSGCTALQNSQRATTPSHGSTRHCWWHRKRGRRRNLQVPRRRCARCLGTIAAAGVLVLVLIIHAHQAPHHRLGGGRASRATDGCNRGRGMAAAKRRSGDSCSGCDCRCRAPCSVCMRAAAPPVAQHRVRHRLVLLVHCVVVTPWVEPGIVIITMGVVAS